MARKQSGRLASLLIFAWLILVVALYFGFHRPVSLKFVVRVASAIWEIVIALALTTLAGIVGAALLPDLKAAPLVRFVLRAALGLAALSAAFLLVGTIIGVNAWMAAVLLLVPLFFLRGYLPIWAADFQLRSLWPQDAISKVIAISTTVLFLFALVTALAPPLKFDSLVYHLTLPQDYLASGRVTDVQANVFSGFPQLPHMLSAWAQALGARWGAVLPWVMGALILFGLLGQLSAVLSPRAAWVAVAALFSGYSLASSLGWGYVDWPTMLFSWGMIFCLSQLSKNDRRLVLLAGIFAGAAFAAKYTAGLLIPLGALAVFFAPNRSLRSVGLFLLGAVGAAAPWLLKNLFFTGNPIYPLVFAGGQMDAFRIAYLQGFAPQGNWLDVVLLPLRATLFGIEGAHIADAPGYEGSLGPLLLALGTLALLSGWQLSKAQRDLKRNSAVIALAGLVVWGVAGRLSGHLIRTHLYYSIFPAFALLSAFGFANLEKLKSGTIRLDRVAGALVGLAMVLNVVLIGHEFVRSRALSFLTGAINETEYLQENLGQYALVMDEVQTLPAGARVLMLWESRGYYCAQRCDPDELIDRWPHDLDSYGAPEWVLAAWRTAGYTHVLHYALGARFISEDPQHFHAFDLSQLEVTLAELPLVADFGGDYQLYALSE